MTKQLCRQLSFERSGSLRDASILTYIFEWFRSFKRGEINVEDHFHSERFSTSRKDENIEKIYQNISKDRRFTIDQISEVTGEIWSSSQQILIEYLQMGRVSAKFE